LLAVIHALVVKTFYPLFPVPSCLDLKPSSSVLGRYAEGIEDGPASRRIAERHAGWASQLPRASSEVWAFLIGLDGDSRLSLMAHCASLTVDAMRNWENRALALSHADDLAVMVGLDMAADWSATVGSYFGRVTKARILEAVREGASAEAAERLAGLKRLDMAEAAETALAGTRWLPPLLRTAVPQTEAVDPAPEAMAAE
jgi:ParB family chromosome partitioning protein